MEKVRKYGVEYLACCCIAVILILCFSSSTSPFYDIFYADYYGNASSIALLMGKAWTLGKIPYKDLFVTGGPLFYMIQSVGWMLGERLGVCILQIINMSLYLIIMLNIFKKFTTKKKSWMWLIIMLFPIAATLTGGNSEEEFSLVLTALMLYWTVGYLQKGKLEKRFFILMGILATAVCMIKITTGGVIFALCMCVIGFSWHKKGVRQALKIFLLMILGGVVCFFPFFVYFYLQDSIPQMLNAVFLYHIKAMWTDFSNITLILHKGIKCMPILLVFLGGIFCIKKNRRKEGSLLLAIGTGLIIFTFTGSGYWHIYLQAAFVLPLLIVVIGQKNKYIIGVALLCMIGVYIMPIWHYVSYITSEDVSLYRQLSEDIIEYQNRTGNEGLLLVDIPASIYIETNNIPTYRYFANHSEFNKTYKNIREELNTYVLENCKDSILVVKSSGGVYEHMGNYVMCDMYYHGHDLLAVYEYISET